MAAAFETKMQPDAAVWITPTRELDVASVRELKRRLECAQTLTAEQVVLDLRSVLFIDSTCYGAILSADSSYRGAGRVLEVIPPTGGAGSVLKLLGSGDRLRFAASVE